MKVLLGDRIMTDTARKLEYDNISGQQNEVKKKLNIIKKIPKIELVWRVVWCVVFMVIFSFFAFGLIRLIFGDSAHGLEWIVAVETAVIVFSVCLFSFAIRIFKELKNVVDEDTEIMTNVVGGTMVTYFDDSFTIINATPVFYSILGYEKNDIKRKYRCEFFRLLVGDDSRREFGRQKRMLRETGFSEAQYKILRGDGSRIWVSSRSHLKKNDKLETVVYTVLFDISREKNMQEKLQLAEARNKIVLENINSGIFEWDMIKNTFEASDQFSRRFMVDENFKIEKTILKKFVHPDDISVLYDNLKLLREGIEDILEILLKLKDFQGIYSHNRLVLSSVRDNNNVPVKAVGIVIDVEEQFQKEMELKNKASRDSLTGLYNKGITQQLIENTILDRGTQNHALILFDIDDFKSVNDTFGHGIGDEAIRIVAGLFKDIFYDDCIVGRIGGDEFMVFCRNIDERGVKVEQLLNKIMERDTFVKSGDKLRNLTLSVGIALYVSDARTYTELYKKADIALYKAKQNGKNRYIFFKDIDED